MRLADEGNHVMLAVAMQLDVGNQHQLVVAFNFGEGLGQVRSRVFGIPAEIITHGGDDTLGSIAQSLADPGLRRMKRSRPRTCSIA